MNDLTFNDCSTILNSIVKQATGKDSITPTNTSEFVAVANTALLSGYDPILNSISQILSRTIFSNRPYTRKFKGLEVTNQQYGNHVRKVQTVDKDFEKDTRLDLTDGEAVDMYTVNKPVVLQTNFYGANTYQKSLTIFRDQLDSAFSGPDEFQRFISMVMGNATDQIEQAHETMARMVVSNFIAGKIAGDADNVIHLVSEYNDVTGLNLDSDSVKKPENYVPFMKWAYGRIQTLSDYLTERTVKYHINVTGKPISRHTPVADQKVYLFSPELNNVSTSVLSSVFHDEFLKMADHEKVNYWQSIDTPSGINITPSYMNTSGVIVTPDQPVVKSNVFGVIFDREAAGYTVVNQWSATTPFNAKGGYSNMFWHFTDRYWNDFTENGIVLLLD